MLLVLGSVVVGVGNAIPASADGISIVQRWRPTNLPTHLKPGNLMFEAVSTKRLLYAMASASMFVYDLDTLQSRAPGIAASPDAWIGDPTTGNLLTATSAAVVAYGLAGNTLGERFRVDLSTTLAPNQRVVAMTVADEGRRVFLLSFVDPLYVAGTGYRSAAAVSGTMTIASVDLVSKRAEWAEPLTGCHLPVALSTKPGFGYVATTHSLYFGCTTPHAPFYKVPVPTGVGRLIVEGGTRSFELFARSGAFYESADSAFDLGSGRLVLGSQTSGAGLSLVAFDGRTNSWVGDIAAGDLSAAAIGMDSRHGRLYMMSGDNAVGLLAADVRPTPVSQGATFPSFVRDGKSLALPGRAITVDEETSRLFLVYSTDEVVIAEDRLPHYATPERPDPDVNTVQVDEKPGVTGVNFAGAAQGYGAAYRIVGGYAAAQFNVAPLDVGAELLPVGAGTREVRGAFLESLGFRNDEAAASAIGVDRDPANTGKDTRDVGWPYERVRCVDFGESPVTTEVNGARVRCDAARGSEAAASSGASHLEAPGITADVGSSSTTSSIQLHQQHGIVSKVAAAAGGISLLGGRLRFGGVSVTSTAKAKGRTGTALSTFERAVHEVVVDGDSLCGSNCDPEAVARAVNARFAGLLRVDFPSPDPSLRASDGGYQAVIRMRPEEQLEAVTLNEQADDRIEVPGMVVTLYTDNARTSRTLLQFAGTAVEARYGVYRIDGSFDTGDDDSLPAFPASTSEGGFDTALPALLGDAGDFASDDGLVVDGLRTGSASNGGGGLGRRLARLLGWGFLRNGAGEVLRTFLVWAILLAPVYLSARRRLFLDRGTLLRRGEG